jgi:DNA-binding CsgD family transcriptional regulator
VTTVTTVTAAWVTAEAERLRRQIEADSLAAELGCEVTPHPCFAGLFEARDPAPGVWLLSGTPDEIRAEWRAAWMREWLPRLGELKRARRRRQLTSREREVAALVAEGLTDQQVARRLSVSLRTVHAHLRNSYAKTGARNRVGLANWLRNEARMSDRTIDDGDRAPFPLDQWPYKVLADRLEDRIRKGEFGEDGPLPTTAELSEWYGQKRAVIRHARQELQRRGQITYKPGHRYFARNAARRP